MQHFVTSSAMTRFCANIIICLVIVGSIAICGWEVVTNQALNPYVLSLAISGITYAAGILNMHTGILANPGATLLPNPIAPTSPSVPDPLPPIRIGAGLLPQDAFSQQNTLPDMPTPHTIKSLSQFRRAV